MRARQRVMVKSSPLILSFISSLDLFPFTIPEGSRQIGNNISFSTHRAGIYDININSSLQRLCKLSIIIGQCLWSDLISVGVTDIIQTIIQALAGKQVD